MHAFSRRPVYLFGHIAGMLTVNMQPRQSSRARSKRKKKMKANLLQQCWSIGLQEGKYLEASLQMCHVRYWRATEMVTKINGWSITYYVFTACTQDVWYSYSLCWCFRPCSCQKAVVELQNCTWQPCYNDGQNGHGWWCAHYKTATSGYIFYSHLPSNVCYKCIHVMLAEICTSNKPGSWLVQKKKDHT